MIIDAEKKEIIREILRIEDDWVIKAIKRLLNLDIEEIPTEHKLILNERIVEYKANPGNVINWEELKAELLKD